MEIGANNRVVYRIRSFDIVFCLVATLRGRLCYNSTADFQKAIYVHSYVHTIFRWDGNDYSKHIFYSYFDIRIRNLPNDLLALILLANLLSIC